MDIEVEIRSFISKEKYEELLDFFSKNTKFVAEDDQKTHYFDCQQDLRIQKNKYYSKIWMKKGVIHDEQREEIEVKCKTEDFDKLSKIFQGIGLKVEIKWFRKRHTFEWEGITVCIDCTRGYGYIIEFEKMSTKEDEEKTLEMLKKKFSELNIELTPREEFDKKYQNYKENWQELMGDEK